MPAAIILGAGIAGLSAAIALRDAGYTVSVYDRAQALEPIGAALSLWPNAVAALRCLGAFRYIAAEAAPIGAMLLATRTGSPIIGPYHIPHHPDGDTDAYLGTRSLLQSALLAALGSGVAVRLGHGAAVIAQDPHGATVRFDDGRRETAAIVVVADGIWSPTATTLLGNPPTYRGYGGVLAISDPLPTRAQTGTLAEYWGRGERFGLGDCGANRRYWFYMRDARADTAPPSRAAISARLSGWPGEITETVVATPTDRLIPFAIHARAAPSRLGQGRVICVGDAAHAMEPNLGQGACQALEDAVALGRIAAACDPAAILPKFEAARLARVRGIVKRSASARFGAHGPASVRTLVAAALRATPAALHTRVISQTHRSPTD